MIAAGAKHKRGISGYVPEIPWRIIGPVGIAHFVMNDF
jgi:hypothetical protein